MSEKVSQSFKPLFKSFDLHRFCGQTENELEEVRFCLQYLPFKRFAPIKKSLEKEIEEKFKAKMEEKVKRVYRKEFAYGTTRFNDKQVFYKLKLEIEVEEEGKRKREKAEELNASEEKLKKDPSIEIKENTEKIADEILKKKVEKETLHKMVKMERGCQLEGNIIASINQEWEMEFEKDEKTYYSYFKAFSLCGRVDAIDRSAQTVLEIKTKGNIDFKNRAMEIGERLQCLSYMHLTKMPKCILLHSGSDGNYITFPIEFDQKEFFERIETKLNAIAVKYQNISKDEFVRLVKKYEDFL